MDIEYLKECLEYRNGRLYWKIRPKSHFKTEKSWKANNTRQAGKPFGSLHGRDSCYYRRGVVQSEPYFEHTLVWMLFNEKLPEHTIDHVNGDGLDNRIENLRDVGSTEQARNYPLRQDNTSGRAGVRKHSRNDSWVVTINSTYKGTRKTYEEAVKFREQLEVEYGYHENHGRISCFP